MNRIVPFALFILVVGCTSKNDDHNKGHAKPGDDPHAGHNKEQAVSKLMIQTDPATPVAGKATTLKIMIHSAGGEMVKSFEVVHEQKVHLILVRDGLDQFAHIHPEVDPTGNLTVSYTFPTGGTYWLYADHKPTGKEQATATASLKIEGDIPAIPALTPNAPGEITVDDLRAKVAIERAKGGGEATITFHLTDAAGQPVKDLQPYMGAMGHLVVLSSDGKKYVHAHPAEAKTGMGNRVVFMAHITEPGLYKGWGQFRRGETVRVVPFVFKAD